MIKHLRDEWPFFLCLATLLGIIFSPLPIENWLPEMWAAIGLFFITMTCVFRVTHHADRLAEMLGEPYGTLILTSSATIIEAAIMLTVLRHNSDNNPTFVRDTISATVMITVGLMLGLAMLIGAFVHRQQTVNTEGAMTYLGLLIPLSILVLILPNFTDTTIGPILAIVQEIFIAIVSLFLYAIFLFIQTRRHRQLFKDRSAPEALSFKGIPHHKPHRTQSFKELAISISWLAANLFLVVFLAEYLAVILANLLEEKQLPDALGGLFVALLILAPECLASVNAALHNRLQRSVNIALGSGLATLSLTVPVILLASSFMGHHLILGLPGNQMIMLIATLWVAQIALVTERTNLMQGTVLLVLFMTFGFLIVVP